MTSLRVVAKFHVIGVRACQPPTLPQNAHGSLRCFRLTPLLSDSRPSGGGIFGTANEYFSSLRWKAANALTSSLDEEEREKLIEKFEPKKEKTTGKEDESTESQPSIAEAVAAAQAKEMERSKQFLEKEREKIMKEAEEAARARVENEMLVQKRRMAFEAWKRDLAEEKEGTGNVSITTAEEQGEQKQVELGDHPVLGPVLVDLGSKRIHVASAKALANIPVWSKQRVYRHERAKSMASDKLKTLHLGLPGIIGIYESTDGSLSILDGQHRVGMLNELQERGKGVDFDFDQVLVEVYPQQDHLEEDDHAKEIFVEVNKAEPVKLVDLPGVAKASHRRIITEGANSLQDRFPEMFKPSQRCRSPHLNIDNLRDALFASNVIERHALKSGKALENWAMEQNEVLAAKFQDEKARNEVPTTAMKKAEKFNFYLGLESSWLYK